jgi:beta-lactamase class D/beta-lactamase class D OXA-42
MPKGSKMKLCSLPIAATGLFLSAAGAHAGILCTAMADATGKVLKKQGDGCDRRVTAASTFKIAISLMGYDSGFLKDEHAPKLPFKQGYPDWIKSWRADTDPASWIKNSVVWYSQQVTQSLGEDRFKHYVTAFGYGNQDVSGDPGKKDGLTRSWLSSSLKISPLEQLSFLEKLVNRQLPVGAHAYDMTARITSLGTLPNGWEIHGKTGAGGPRAADGNMDGRRAYGWFVGWATKDGRTVVFARLIQNEKKEPVSPGLRARETMMRELPGLLDSK